MEGLTSRKILKLMGAVLGLGLLAGCGQSEAPDDASPHAPEIVRVKTAAQALEGAHVPTLDPSTMNGAEIRKVIGARPHCTFRYTSTGKPIVVVGMDQGDSPTTGVVKLNGSLVALKTDPAAPPNGAGGFVLVADPVRLSVQPDPRATASVKPDEGRFEAEMVFEVGQQLKVGYGGYLECRTALPAPASVQ
jgi:hypothetical protein